MPDEFNSSTEGASGSGSRVKLIIAIVIVILAVAGYFYFSGSGRSVAVVNGEKISLSQYNETYNQLSAALQAQGVSATSSQAVSFLKQQALTNLINETLILQKADSEGIGAKASDVDSVFNQAKSQFPDAAAFSKALTTQGYTEATFRHLLTKQNIESQYFEKHLSLSTATATAQEITALYNQAVSSGQKVPPLSQVRAQVAQQIVQQKQQQLVSSFIDKLKASSTIQTLLK